MTTYNHDRARRAVQFLVNSSYFVPHRKKLCAAVGRPRAMPFKGEAEPLNELLVIGRQNRQAMENLLDIAQFKRSVRGSYQKQYMARKRHRDHKVIELETLLCGKKLSVDERKTALVKQYKLWGKERDEFLAKQGELSWADRNTAIQQFWDAKEQELDALIDEASTTLNKVVHRKRTFVVEKQPKTVLGAKLQEALKRGKLKLKHQ